MLEVLKEGISTEQLLQAIKAGKKLKELWEYVKKCKEDKLDIQFDSFIMMDVEGEPMGE